MQISPNLPDQDERERDPYFLQGHAGDGNMHIQLMRDDMDKKLFGERCPKLMEELYAQAKIMGGQVSGEHGIDTPVSVHWRHLWDRR